MISFLFHHHLCGGERHIYPNILYATSQSFKKFQMSSEKSRPFCHDLSAFTICLYTTVCEIYYTLAFKCRTLQWRYNGRDGISNHQPHDCLLNRLCRRRPKKTSKLRVTSHCGGNSPVTCKFPAQRASYTEIVSI